MAVGEWLQKIINDKTLSCIGWNDATRDLFKEGRSLFYSRLLGDFRNLRDKEDDYTLVCYPSLNEGDIEHVYVQNPFGILIPADVEDTTRLGTIMEAMIADTYDNVMDPSTRPSSARAHAMRKAPRSSVSCAKNACMI